MVPVEIPRVVGVVRINVILDFLDEGREGRFCDGACFCGDVAV